MKKKYFFGIFICLVLFCSGVFLLATNNFNTVEQIIINDQTDAIDIAITVTIDKVYGLGGQYISGATFNITVGREDKNGGNRKAGSTFDLSIYPASSYKGTVDASWLANYRYMTINSTAILSGGKYGDSTITTDYGWIESNRGSGGITGFRVRHDTADAYREGSFTLDIYWGIKYNCKYENGTGGSTNFYFSTKDNVAKTKPTIPTRTGYTFNGYYTATSGGIKLVDEKGNWTGAWNQTSARPAQLYAQWEPISYNIGYNLNSGSYGENHPTSANFGNTVTISNPTRIDGYHFTGWTIENYSPGTAQSGILQGLSGFFGIPTWYDFTGEVTDRLYFRNLQTTDRAIVTFTANWEINTYKVRFNANGGSGAMSDQSFTYGTSQNLTKNSFTKAGYTFAGWNRKSDGTGDSYSDQEIVDKLTNTNNATVTLYAQWQVNNLKANLNYMGGIVESSSLSQQYNKDGTYLSLPEKPSRIGYTFIGWNTADDGSGKYYTSGTNFNDSTQVEAGHCVATANAGNIEFTLYAIWEANEYKINYNLAGGSHGSSHPTTAKYDSVVNISNPTKVGYTFAGWSATTSSGLNTTTAKSGTSNSLSALKTWNGSATKNTYFANLTADPGTVQNGVQIAYATVTLTANWTANTYTIAFNGNGSTGGSTSSMKATYDSNVTLTANGFIKAGYVFTGWNTEKKGSGKSYSDKETVKNLTSVDGATVTLYAQWEETWANHASSSLKTTQINGVTYNVIASAEDLAYLSKQSISSTLLGKYIQTADIDLSDYTWLPIGSENAFCGEYLGQGYKITGLKTCDAKNANKVYLQTYGGLFGKLGKNSTNGASANIVGVYITDCLVYGQYSGAIAGFSDDESVNIDSVNIEACILENVKIYGDTNTTASFVGSSSDGQIKDCLLISSNILTANTTTRGFYTGTMTVKSCYFVENNSATRFTGASSDYSNWVTGVFKYPLPKALIWYPGA